jgi:hypothetical protein
VLEVVDCSLNKTQCLDGRAKLKDPFITPPPPPPRQTTLIKLDPVSEKVYSFIKVIYLCNPALGYILLHLVRHFQAFRRDISEIDTIETE